MRSVATPGRRVTDHAPPSPVCTHRYPSPIAHHDALLADLRDALGPNGASAESLELALYARDAGVSEGQAVAVCWLTTATSGADAASWLAMNRPLMSRSRSADR